MLKATNQSNFGSSYIYIYIYIYRFALTLLLLSLPVLISLANIVSGSAHAESLDYDVIVQPSLALTLSSPTVSFHLNPASNSFNSGNLNVSVATNNLNGYKLYITTAEGSGGESTGTNGTKLVNTTSSTNYIDTLPTSGTPDCSITPITPSASGCTESEFPVNKWGYRISAGTNTNPDITDTTTGPNSKYFPYASNTLISSSASTTNNDTTTLTFAAKADYEKPAGAYDISLNFKTIPIVTQTHMQNMNPGVCTETPTIVIDSRDEQPYLIQRLADGKCWMLDNLNLDLTNQTIAEGLTSQNTNATDTALNYLRNGGGNVSDKWAIDGLTLSNWLDTPARSYSVPLINKAGSCETPSGSSVSCTYDGTYTNNTILSNLTPNQSTFGLGSGKIGIYYNYCAVSAGSYCYGSGATSAGTPSGNADMDICPVSWRLPTGGPNGEYQALCNVANSDTCINPQEMDASNTTSMQYMFSLSLSGDYASSLAHAQGRFGTFWSSTLVTSSRATYIFFANSTSVSPQYSTSRLYGRSVRCVLNEPQS